MRVLVAGSSGLIGTALVERLRGAGHEVHRLVRRDARHDDERNWDPPAGRIQAGAFDGVDAVVNLCGAKLFPQRWSAARKQVIVDSRVEPTEVLADAVTEHGVPILINSSASGYYGDSGPRAVDESAPAGTGFLAELCVAWEAATGPAKEAGARVVSMRTGPIISGRGGLLGPLKPLFRLGLGGRLGEGNQYLPWIGDADAVAAIHYALEVDALSGPVNLAGPNPVTNAEFTRAMGRALHRPTPWRAPAIALKAALGQVAEEMALYGQRAVPRALEAAGFAFIHPQIDDALTAAFR